MNPLKALVHHAGKWYINRICRTESLGQKFTHHNERPIEYRFALDCLARVRPRSVLDVGTGTTSWPHLLSGCGFVTTAIDNMRDYWDHQMVNRHWTVLDFDITQPGEFHGPFDAVTCISVMEHIENHEAAIQNMLNLLAPSGLLIITTPYNHSTYCPNVYKLPDVLYGQDQPYICRSHSAKEIEKWQQLGMRLKRRELWRLFSGPVWATGNRIAWEQVHSEDEPHQLGCFEFEKL
jgi:2-polyprenyl-3-methyl-5-hydroxy-6-metoxy-1,4-benzoquinol methylase